MNFSRNTYLEVDLGKIKNNVKTIINNYPAYKYYFGLVKANCYGLDNESLAVTKAIIDAGCNYLAVATLEEAIVIRKEFKSIPILVLGHINKEHIKEAIEYNITITIHSEDSLEEILAQNLNGLKAHIKINTPQSFFLFPPHRSEGPPPSWRGSTPEDPPESCGSLSFFLHFLLQKQFVSFFILPYLYRLSDRCCSCILSPSASTDSPSY